MGPHGSPLLVVAVLATAALPRAFATLRGGVPVATNATRSAELTSTDVLRLASLDLVDVDDKAALDASKPTNPKTPYDPMPTSDLLNPKCDQACTNGDLKQRQRCNSACAKMQLKLCTSQFVGCHKACENHRPTLKPDPECRGLCDHVQLKLCYPLVYEAPKGAVIPTTNKVPPVTVYKSKVKIFKGSFLFCNLFPADYDFDVLALPEGNVTTGPKLTSISYKQCKFISMQSYQKIGLSVKGKLAGVSRPINKIPSIMVFGQWAFGNHQIEFNRYFAKGDGAYVCNGFPMWAEKDVGKEVELLRGGYSGHTLARLRYKECVPTGASTGELLAAKVDGQRAGEYKLQGYPSAVVLGKAGQTTAIAFEAWRGNEH